MKKLKNTKSKSESGAIKVSKLPAMTNEKRIKEVFFSKITFNRTTSQSTTGSGF